MAAISISVDGIDAVIANLERHINGLQPQIEYEIHKAGFDTRDLAKKIVPVDSGELRSSIIAETGFNEATVKALAYYAVYVELGTRKMRPRPFLYRSFRRQIPLLMQRLRALI